MRASPELPQFKFIGFTGHRALSDQAAVRTALREALTQVRATLPAAEWVAVSSIAEGADMLFAETARAAGLAWQVVLPLPEHEFKNDFSAEQWAEVAGWLAQAEQCTVVPPTLERTEAYLDAGLETVDRADVLIAVWDGEASRGQGGTAEVVTYAREIGCPVLRIDPTSGAVMRENFEPGPKADGIVGEINALPAGVGDAVAFPGSVSVPAALAGFMAKADASATSGAPHFRRMMGGTVMLHVLATLVAVMAIVFGWHWVGLPWIKLLCLVGAVAVAFVLARSHTHHRWLRHRIAAEVSRAALGAWGLRSELAFLDNIPVPELKGLLRSIRQLHLRERTGRSGVTLPEFKASYLATRIEGQTAYYRKQEDKAAPLAHRLKMGFWWATWAAIACTSGYAVAATLHLPVAHEISEIVFYLLPICLPVVAAGCMSFVSINDLQRRVARYRDMQALLERSRRQLEVSHSWHAVAKVVAITEEGLLQELLEWHAISRYSESH